VLINKRKCDDDDDDDDDEVTNLIMVIVQCKKLQYLYSLKEIL